MGTEIYYFSGSGNSLHVARELARRVPEADLQPMVAYLDQESVVAEAEAVGLVFPIHGLAAPIPVRWFARRLDPSRARYLFAIATRASTPHRAFEEIDAIFGKRGRRLDAAFTLTMPDNNPKLRDWRPLADEEAAALESRLQARLDELAAIVAARRPSREPDTDCPVPVGPLLLRLVPLALRYAEWEGLKDYFSADDRCTGCGRCASVCPAGKVRMVGGRPEWQRDVKCFMCYACINYCPAHASQIKSKAWMRSHTGEHGRYAHPWARADEIAAQRDRAADSQSINKKHPNSGT